MNVYMILRSNFISVLIVVVSLLKTSVEMNFPRLGIQTVTRQDILLIHPFTQIHF